MLTIPQKQLFDRRDNLPQVLRDALVSEINSDFVWKTAEDEHLSEDKIRTVSKLAGWVLMGFIHPEDLADEIKNNLSIHPNIANSIASTLNARIFSPLRAELDKVYAPAVPEKPEAPKIVEEIKKPPVPERQETRDKRQEPETTAPVPPKPISVMPSPVSPPAPAPVKASETPKAPTPVSPTPSSPPAAPVAPVGPVIIHQESEFQPIRPSASFKLEIPTPEPRGGKPAWAAPPKPAQIELGNIPAPPAAKPKPPVTPIPDIPRVVHYSDLKTPLPATPPKPGDKPEPKFPPRPVARPSIFSSAPPSAPKPVAEIPKPKPEKAERPALNFVERMKEKILPAKKFLPDPLKEPELPEG